MGDPTEHYHTHAKGAEFGWWGAIIHPAHFDDKDKEIPNTAWAIETHNEPTLEKCREICIEKAKSRRK